MSSIPDTRTSLVTDVVTCLHNGGVALLPTDTVYGLAVLPDKQDAVAKLYELKARPRAKSLPIMFSNRAQLHQLGMVLNDRVERLLASDLVPGALTIVAGLDTNTCPDWLSGRDEIAVRMPDNLFLLDVIEKVGPLLVTSANLHGCPTETDAGAILRQLNGAPDLVVEGSVTSDIPSTLVNCRVDPVVVERSGALPVSDIAKVVAVKHG